MTIVVYRFFITYARARETREHLNPVTGHMEKIRVETGETREVHNVEYGPLGSDKTRVIAQVEHLRPKIEIGEEVQPGSALEMTKFKWDNVIFPAYQKWLAGQEITREGTPLAAWSGVGPEQAEGLKRKGIHTVEDLAELTDTHIQSYGIQNLRVLRDNAKRFVASKDSRQIDAALEQKDIQIAGLTDQVEELKRLVAELAARPVTSVRTQAENTDPGNDDAFGATTDVDTTDAVPVTRAPRQPRASLPVTRVGQPRASRS